MYFYNQETILTEEHRTHIGPLGITILFIFVIFFPISGAETTTEYFEGLFDTTIQEETVEVTTEESVRNSTSNPYAKYIFGLPPIPIDPSIPGVESDDDFETLAPFTPDQVYNKNWFISGFDKENRPIILKVLPRINNAAPYQILNPNVAKLLGKIDRYRKYIVTKAVQIRSTKEKPVTQCVAVVDFINSNSYSTLAANATYAAKIKHDTAKSRQFIEKYQKEEIILNVGYVGELAIRLFARVGIRRHFQVYGPDKATWLQALQRKFPRDQLPEDYGGVKGHIPIKLYPG